MSDAESPGLGLDLPDELTPAKAAASPYRVLARKYRPQTFSELIGQDAMVKTLANAIARDRIAHAFLLTGVRGVGKTSTARLIAKALNCIGPDGQGGPTITPCNVWRAVRGNLRGPPYRRDRNGRSKPHRHRRHPRDHRCGALCFGQR